MTPRLILASGSPRRRELLAHLGQPFEVITSRYDEEQLPTVGIAPKDYVQTLAQGKAGEVAERTEGNAIIVGADTTVVFGEIFLNKPIDTEDAARMLRLLSNKTHQVYTGICAVSVNGDCVTDYAVTDVIFQTLTEAQIAEYITTGEPMDKAGSYGIQGQGRVLIWEIHGDYDSVMGLPLRALRELLLPFFPGLYEPPMFRL